MKLIIKESIRPLFNLYTKLVCKFFPYSLGKSLSNRTYKKVMKKSVKFNNPQNLIEKIIWLQFYSDTSLWTRCADKFKVREYIQEKGLDFILPELYGCWEDSNEINFEALPSSFILKTNHGCGQNIIVKDKTSLDISRTRKRLKRWLKTRFGCHDAQLHYLKIPPKVIAEELLIDKSLNNKENLIDYKIWCIEGEPQCILVVSDRDDNSHKNTLYSIDWENISDLYLNKNSTSYGGTDISKPKNLNKMLEYAKTLSEGIPEVRVDFYNINGKIYFGEMTFTSGFGSFTEEYYNYLGSKISLNKIKKIRK